MTLLLLLWACSGKDKPADPVEPVHHDLDPTPYTTLQAVWKPTSPTASAQKRIDQKTLEVFDIPEFDDAGLGVVLQDGREWIEHTELAPNFVEGRDRRSVMYAWQAADPQIIDEESPIRLEALAFLYRPQGHLTAQVWEQHVRTAQRLSDLSGRPFEFGLLAGDITDGSQANEFDWAYQALGGGVIDPDSGRDDDPVPGSGNDYNDPFLSEGLAVDWYAALGNHDANYNGGFDKVTPEIREASVGSAIYDFVLFSGTNGYRDGATLDGDVVTEGTTVADAGRLVLNVRETLQKLHDAPGTPAGHGLTQDAVDAGEGWFSVHPVKGAPVRLVVLDTVHSNGGTGAGAEGFIERAQFEWLLAELADADDHDELVVVMTHHRAKDLVPSSAVGEEDLTAALAASDGVVLHVTGHGHENEMYLHPPAPQTVDYGYWELMLASTVDFPMHSRIIEIVDERNGYISIYCTNIGHNSPPGSLAHRARELAAAKRAFPVLLDEGGVKEFWADDIESQNLLLRVEISPAIQKRLARYDGFKRIESEETLAKLNAP